MKDDTIQYLKRQASIIEARAMRIEAEAREMQEKVNEKIFHASTLRGFADDMKEILVNLNCEAAQ